MELDKVMLLIGVVFSICFDLIGEGLMIMGFLIGWVVGIMFGTKMAYDKLIESKRNNRRNTK